MCFKFDQQQEKSKIQSAFNSFDPAIQRKRKISPAILEREKVKEQSFISFYNLEAEGRKGCIFERLGQRIARRQ